MSTENWQQQATGAQHNSQGRQYLSFVLDTEEYGIDILRVQELRGWTPVTPVPDMPEYIKGVLNLRGAIIPVVDLRKRFGLPKRDYGPTTVVIVIKVDSGSKERIMGIIVDAVAETYTLTQDQIQPPPKIGGGVSSEFITGLVAQNDKMIVLMDIDELMNSDELAIDVPALSNVK
ncbi:MAG: positive regulator of CheA protein activity [Osedax symbiont Rs2]|nr:MAG: positive regulator of CheA protein activity [Osedax symbiont Rs2]